MSNTKIPAAAQNVPVPVATDLEKTRDLQIEVDLDPIATLQAEKAVLEARLLKMELSTQPYIRRALAALASRLWWLGKKLLMVVAGATCLMGVLIALYQHFILIPDLKDQNRECSEKLGGSIGLMMNQAEPHTTTKPAVVTADEAVFKEKAPAPKPDTTKVVAPKAKPPAVSNGEMGCKEGQIECNIPLTAAPASTDTPPAADKSAPKAGKKVATPTEIPTEEYEITLGVIEQGLLRSLRMDGHKVGLGTLVNLNDGREVTDTKGQTRTINCPANTFKCLDGLHKGEKILIPAKK